MRKYRLKEAQRAIGIYSEDFKEMAGEIIKDASRMSYYRSHKEPQLLMGSWPGIALWKIKVLFTTDVEKDISYKTEDVKP
jgi:hypothetical protein